MGYSLASDDRSCTGRSNLIPRLSDLLNIKFHPDNVNEPGDEVMVESLSISDFIQ